MNRFFVSPADIVGDSIYIRGKDDIRHMLKVLRLREGNELEISDGEQYEYRVVIDEISPDEVCCRIHDKQNFAREPRLKVTLFQGVPKQGKMETIIQKMVEMGVGAIIPVFTARTVAKPGGKLRGKAERMQKVADEAVKQCKRGVIPFVREAVSFRTMLQMLQSGEFDLILFPYEGERQTTIKQVLRAAAESAGAADADPPSEAGAGHCLQAFGSDGEFRPSKSEITARPCPDLPEKACVIIGPEGGFSDEEAKALQEAGARSVSLGRTVLRTETAGLVAVAMLMYELEL